jgi:hypothetical protein
MSAGVLCLRMFFVLCAGGACLLLLLDAGQKYPDLHAIQPPAGQ